MKYVIVHTITGEHTWEFNTKADAEQFYYTIMSRRERAQFHIGEYEDV